jgi:hypothetical protein
MIAEVEPVQQTILGFAVVLAALVIIWFFILLSFLALSGWLSLRKIYACPEVTLVQVWLFQQADFPGRYGLFGLLNRSRGLFRFGYSNTGVFAAGMFFVGFFFKPVLIPWDEAMLEVIDGYCLTTTRVPEISIMISKAVYDGLRSTGRITHLDGFAELRS